jgi:rhodanese-related sulfurtransferase
MEDTLKNFTLEFFGKGKHKTTPAAFFDTKESVILLDVRSKQEADSISINLKHHKNIKCLNIPVDEIPDRIDEIPVDKLVALFCPASVRSAIVYGFLMAKGLANIRILEGGYPALTDALLPGRILQITQ